MKNQYFGDIRDLFKFDLANQILAELELNNFIFIPMLTDDDSRNDGNKINYSLAKAGHYNLDLVYYLKYKLRIKSRNANEVVDYFNFRGINSFVATERFTNDCRKQYFKKAIKLIKPDSIVLLDPDNGLEVKNSNEKHVLFSEINSIIQRMDDSSVLMIYQHFSRENHINFTLRKVEQLFLVTGIKSQYITDNEIIFFFLAKNIELQDSLAKVLKSYKHTYKQLIIDITKLKNNQQKFDF